MASIITYLLTLINYQNQVIRTLLTLLIGKSMFEPPKSLEKPVNQAYRKLRIDDLPIVETFKKQDYRILLQEHLEAKGKPLKPIKRHANSTVVPEHMTCPQCDAPSSYQYPNNGPKGQYQCKVCHTRFSHKNRFRKEAAFKCPHCMRSLEKVKVRKFFDVYKCKNDACSYYEKNLNALTTKERAHFQTDPQAFKMRYIYRQFHIDFKPISKQSPEQPKVDLKRLHVSPHTLGLILTYHINYGLSYRRTAAIMRDIHNVTISHQSISNYERAAALYLKPFVDHYPYDLSNQFCGDETYIRVQGRWHYIFFFFDAVKKIILSYPVSPNRDTVSAIKAIDEVLVKLKTIPENLTFVVDGNPIYLLAQHFFAQHDIPFHIKQVIGLTNEDEVSREYRPLKQIIERLNRTFKGNYRATHGFGSSDGSVSYVTLFVAYFNFLRPHSAIEGRVPVVIPELEKLPHMPARWTTLLSMAQDWLVEQQS